MMLLNAAPKASNEIAVGAVFAIALLAEAVLCFALAFHRRRYTQAWGDRVLTFTPVRILLTLAGLFMLYLTCRAAAYGAHWLEF